MFPFLLFSLSVSLLHDMSVFFHIIADENYDVTSSKYGNSCLYGQAEVLAHVVRQNRRSKHFQRNLIFEEVKSQFAIREKSEKLNEIFTINSLNSLKISSVEERKSTKNKRKNSTYGTSEKKFALEKKKTNTRCDMIIFSHFVFFLILYFFLFCNFSYFHITL